MLRFLLATVLLLATAGAACAQGRVTAEAYVGAPFGVCRLTMQTAAGGGHTIETHGFTVSDAEGRVLYPAYTVGRLGNLVRGLLGAPPDANAPHNLTAMFLFRGDAPLRVTIAAPQPQTVVVTPRAQPRGHERMLRQWWRDYNGSITERRNANDVPPLIDLYLSQMLATRLGLDAPFLARVQQLPTDEPQRTLELLAGTERRYEEVVRGAMQQNGPRPQATMPLPAAPAWRAPAVPDPPGPIDLEPMARHVPAECFYVRFGNYDNHLWFRQLMEDYGGDLGRMVTLRGHDPQISRRMERQLALKDNALAKLFGSQVVADVAIVGRDTLLADGAAFGMLFHAKNTALLANDFRQQRAAALAREQANGAREETIELAGRKVQFLHTPDNSLRSFWATDGDFHLVTTSRTMAQRFLEAGAGQDALADLPEFRAARASVPANRGDTAFAFFSSRFFQGLASPQYCIELWRRLEVKAMLELSQMAAHAARAEGAPTDLAALVERGYLPRGPLLDGNGSLDAALLTSRGARGTFTPIPDVPVESVTLDEARRYAALAGYFGSQWGEMDPIVVAVRRFAIDKAKGLERVVIDAHVSPFVSQKYGWITGQLGPPRRERLAMVPGDVLSVQAVMRTANTGDVYHLFAGLRNDAPRLDLGSGGLLQTLRVLQGMPGYLGAWPKPGFLDVLPPFLRGGQPDAFGYTALPFGLWRRQWDFFSVLSFQRPVLDQVSPLLGFELAPNPAQVRVRVEDLSAARAAASINTLSYARARETTLGNARLLNMVSEQFRLPRAEALAVTEDLLGTRLVCSLGGEYKLLEQPGMAAVWSSSTLLAPGDEPLANYQSPVLGWLRAVDADLIVDGDRLVAHAEIDMQRKVGDPGVPVFELPLFNLFGGPREKKPEPPGEDFPPPKPQPPQQPAPNPATPGAREF